MYDKQYKVLLIEDDQNWARTLKRRLENENLPGYLLEVTIENDSDQAFDVYRKLQPDILILDIDLGPRKPSGLSLCKRLSSTPQYQQKKFGIIIVSSKYIELNDELISFKMGAGDYISRINDDDFFARLFVRLDAMLRQLVPQTNTLDFDERLYINVSECQVTLDNNLIELSQSEFDILAYLAKPDNINRSHTGNEIKEATGYTAIRKTISRLRAKITPDNLPKNSYIKTIRGGYSLYCAG